MGMKWMKNNPKLALVISLVVLIGVPFLFLIMSLITDQWSYLFYAIVPSLVAGLTGLWAATGQLKKQRNA